VEVLVVGAGVTGLTTALALAEAGVSVRVVTKDPVDSTLSVAAGAIWGPYMVAHEHGLDWALQTLDRLSAYGGDPVTGVEMVDGIEAARTPIEPPKWTDALPNFRRCRLDELPGNCRSGWEYTAAIVNMPMYLAFLEQELRRRRIVPEIGPVTSLTALRQEAAVVVNCTGLAAKELVPDPEVEPIRGELVVVNNPGITRFFLEHEEEPPHLTYFLPQGDTVIMGGTAEHGRRDLAPDPGTAEAIRARCAVIEPKLADARILSVRVGVRPHRRVLRVERDGQGIVHNYGHGGSGLTLSWGCASYVRDLILGVVPDPGAPSPAAKAGRTGSELAEAPA